MATRKKTRRETGRDTRSGRGAAGTVDPKAAIEDAKDAAEASQEAAPGHELAFSAAFFEEQFPGLIRTEDGLPSQRERDYAVTVYLGDGLVHFDIGHIEQLRHQFMLVASYDHQQEEPGPARYVFVPYAMIARIEVNALESRLRPIGFAARPSGENGAPSADGSASTRRTRKKPAAKKPSRRKRAAKKLERKKPAPGKKATKKKAGRRKPR